tara:strand:- start:982 stop:1425 length:444 start_codon:yes stop_codon:yes gene_type:complete
VFLTKALLITIPQYKLNYIKKVFKMDIQLGENHDIEIVDGDFKLTPTEQLSIRQKLIIKLLTYQGEWFLSSEEGLPFFQSILGKNRSKETIDTIYKRAILSTEGVLEIVSFRSNITPQREYVMQFIVRTVEDTVLEPIELSGFNINN